MFDYDLLIKTNVILFAGFWLNEFLYFIVCFILCMLFISLQAEHFHYLLYIMWINSAHGKRGLSAEHRPSDSTAVVIAPCAAPGDGLTLPH